MDDRGPGGRRRGGPGARREGRSARPPSDSDAAEAEEERCEEELDRQEDALDDRADDALGTAWDDVRSGDVLDGGLTLPEGHVAAGAAHPRAGRAPGAVAGDHAAAAVGAGAEQGRADPRVTGWRRRCSLLLFLIPVSGLLLVTGTDDWLPCTSARTSRSSWWSALHIALVLKHTVIQRDRHLARMLVAASVSSKKSRARNPNTAATRLDGKVRDAGVVGAHVAVVEAPRGGDPVLGEGQLALEVQEVRARLEVRVGLDPGQHLLRAPGRRSPRTPRAGAAGRRGARWRPRGPGPASRAPRARGRRTPARSRPGWGSGRGAGSARRRCRPTTRRPACAAGRTGCSSPRRRAAAARPTADDARRSRSAGSSPVPSAAARRTPGTRSVIPSITASVASICAGVRWPSRDHQHRVLLEAPARVPVLSRNSIICGCRTSEANLRSGQLTVNARLKSSDSSSMSLSVSRPTNRSRKFSGSTLSGGSDDPHRQRQRPRTGAPWSSVCFPDPLVGLVLVVERHQVAPVVAAVERRCRRGARSRGRTAARRTGPPAAAAPPRSASPASGVRRHRLAPLLAAGTRRRPRAIPGEARRGRRR